MIYAQEKSLIPQLLPQKIAVARLAGTQSLSQLFELSFENLINNSYYSRHHQFLLITSFEGKKKKKHSALLWSVWNRLGDAQQLKPISLKIYGLTYRIIHEITGEHEIWHHKNFQHKWEFNIAFLIKSHN